MADINLPVPGSDFNTWGEKLNNTVAAVNDQGEPANVRNIVSTDIDTVGSDIEGALSAKIVAGIADAPLPTIDQLSMSTAFPTMIDPVSSFPLLSALYPMRLDQVSLLIGNGNASSDTDFWAVDLNRNRAGIAKTIASKNTRVTDGQSIVSYTPWSFDTVEFSDYAVLAAGDSLSIVFTKVGSPSNMTPPTVTYRVPATSDPSPPNPVVLGVDSFTRADNATSIGAADIGAWTVMGGSTWGISGNAAYVPVAGPTRDMVVMDAALADVQVQTKVTPGWESGHSGGLVVRATDVNNHYQITASGIWKLAGGTATLVASPGVSYVNGDSIRAVIVGSSFKVYRQAASVGAWVLAQTATDSTHLTQTKHGLTSGGNSGRTNKYDDFRIESV